MNYLYYELFKVLVVDTGFIVIVAIAKFIEIKKGGF